MECKICGKRTDKSSGCCSEDCLDIYEGEGQTHSPSDSDFNWARKDHRDTP